MKRKPSLGAVPRCAKVAPTGAELHLVSEVQSANQGTTQASALPDLRSVMDWTRRADRHARLGQWERSLAIYDQVIDLFEHAPSSEEASRSPAHEFFQPLGLARAQYDELARGAVQLARARIL